METKHTPGPWGTDGDGMHVTVDGEFFKLICDIRGWGWLQKMGYEKARETQIANAKLIAAAPELLEALKEVIAISDRDHSAWDYAKSIIKKATE